ncbi:MAG: alkaline phosphatase family protein [Chloroflexota bacterium]
MKPKNILFIMCDQLRWDYLSCYGHPHLQTPHVDALARQGVRFNRAYVQAPLCGPSRASCYTGRYVFSVGSTWNTQPLPLGEYGIGDYLRPHGVRTALVGKAHTIPDRQEMARLGVDPQSQAGILATHGGFEPFERDDGLHPDRIVNSNLAYNRYLKEQGYDAQNPWNQNANGALDDDDNPVSGWYMRHNNRPANIAEEHSETPYMTTRAMDCIEAMGDTPWCIHLSYIKPHWPYVAPAPYHNMYGAEHCLSLNRHDSELKDPHPIYKAFTQIRGSRNFTRQEVREAVIPAYMGLVKQIDDQIGRLVAWLEEKGYMENTLIVFTSDHGDYLGDHWLYEKDLFHEESVRTPLIIYDPSAEADATRGTVDNHFVELIDLAPTFLDVVGGESQPHRLEGRSLLPLLHQETVEDWRTYAISEIDYSGRAARQTLGLDPNDCRGYMIRTARYKYILWEGFPPQLFDLENDPQEFVDLGRDPNHEEVRRNLHEALFTWLRKRKIRTTISDSDAAKIGPEEEDKIGILIGYWSEDEGPF